MFFFHLRLFARIVGLTKNLRPSVMPFLKFCCVIIQMAKLPDSFPYNRPAAEIFDLYASLITLSFGSASFCTSVSAHLTFSVCVEPPCRSSCGFVNVFSFVGLFSCWICALRQMLLYFVLPFLSLGVAVALAPFLPSFVAFLRPPPCPNQPRPDFCEMRPLPFLFSGLGFFRRFRSEPFCIRFLEGFFPCLSVFGSLS